MLVPTLLAAVLLLGGQETPKEVQRPAELRPAAELQPAFNKAANVPRLVVILSPS